MDLPFNDGTNRSAESSVDSWTFGTLAVGGTVSAFVIYIFASSYLDLERFKAFVNG